MVTGEVTAHLSNISENGADSVQMANPGTQDPSPTSIPKFRENLDPLDPTKLISTATVDLKDWGFPGYLTNEEFNVLVSK